MKNFRKTLRSRKPVIGSWMQTGNPAAAEILAQAGYDWLGIDCEHTSIDIAGVEALCRATHGRGPAMLVRVRSNDTLAIRQALDVGADGVIVPLVHDAEQARQAAAAAKYPPRGVRGHTFGRMNNWGADFAEYARTANERVVVIVMIESRAGVENIAEILAVPDVDGVFIGPYDLSASYGVTGQINHPLLAKARQRILAACRKAGKVAGVHLVGQTDKIPAGFTFICLDADSIFLRRSAVDVLARARKALRK